MHNDKHTANQIIMLLETILGQKYFTFKNQIYQPDKGVAMCSRISRTLAKIFLQQPEKSTLNTL
jgi:predicted nuclease of restriction endonuclease-like RecB superfamily